MKKKGKVRRGMSNRPAESGGVAGAAALIVCKIAGVDDPETLFAIGVVIGFIPAGITWLVTTIRNV